MARSFPRREFLRTGATVASGLIAAGLAPGSAAMASTPIAAMPTRRSPYLQGNYAPVDAESTAFDLPVKGRLPTGLVGHFIRNGPNPVERPTGPYSWFGGDGMLHLVELDGGRARSYRSRWITTPTVAKARHLPPPSGPPATTGLDLSNTSTARLGGRLLSLTEGAIPYEFTTEGATVARTDLDGALTHGLSAHAKEDPTTGEVHQIGYRVITRPYAVWQVIDASGQVTTTQPIDLPESVMIHQTTLTPSYVLVYDLPVVFSPTALKEGWPVPFRWDSSHQARLGVIIRATGALTWIDLPPLFAFHDASAWDTPHGLTVRLVTYPSVFAKDPAGPLPDASRLEEWDVDLATATVRRTVLDDRPQEFPRIAPSTYATAARYTYTVASPTKSGDLGSVLGLGNAVVRHDHLRHTTASWSPGRGHSLAEAVFVDDPERHAEDGGWLLAFSFDAARSRSSFVVLDAEDVASGPIATVGLPQRVPIGFHGNWYPAV